MDLPPLEELLKERPKRGEITAILKRDSLVPVPFDVNKIVSAVSKSSVASGKNYSLEESKEIADQVMMNLRMRETFEHSMRAIPNVEDVQDTVIETLIHRNAKQITERIILGESNLD